MESKNTNLEDCSTEELHALRKYFNPEPSTWHIFEIKPNTEMIERIDRELEKRNILTAISYRQQREDWIDGENE